MGKSENIRLTNYHTHTRRCMHAENTDEEYVQAAIGAGYQDFGFADHSPWPYRGGFVSSIRMTVDQLDEYLESICTMKKSTKIKSSCTPALNTNISWITLTG